MKNLFDIKKKCIVVIGGSGKIGSIISQALAKLEAKVFILSRNAENKSIRLFKNNKNIYRINMDQSKTVEIKEALAKIKKIYKSPEVLINCSLIRPMKKFFADNHYSWDQSMITNARGLFLTSQIFGGEMKKNKKGSIINFSSIYGVVAPDQAIYKGEKFETEPDYPFIKGGTIMFTKYLASIFSKFNIRANVIIPGGFKDKQSKSFQKKYKKKTLIGRMANYSEILGPVVFLSSDASSYITGSSIVVDGGFTAI